MQNAKVFYNGVVKDETQKTQKKHFALHTYVF